MSYRNSHRFSRNINESYPAKYDISIDNIRDALDELEESIHEQDLDEHSVSHAFELVYFGMQLIQEMTANTPVIRSLFKDDTRLLKKMADKI